MLSIAEATPYAGRSTELITAFVLGDEKSAKPSPNSIWLCKNFLSGVTDASTGLKWGAETRLMSEQWDTSYWLWSDIFNSTTNQQIHSSAFSSINVCYVDGHAKFTPVQAVAVFK